ncbi:PAM68 family protein [Prochlorococcus sp. MIT 1300]|uniref:PAM68 family protein n=1 Tax=Prochlorococcus sp. MIT 1300 TaxID=3096218 RepID=UPI002A74D03E|nr:PAM68 family protein [Prochlorococcus sp. MIT 1300]
MTESPNKKSFLSEGPQSKKRKERSPQKAPKLSKKIPKSNKQSGIPKSIANRMARRVVLTTGLPTVTGMGVFILSYILVTRGIADVPPALTLITSAACFFIGLVGLSYGILSTSWEETNGSFLGFENIKPNISRMRSAFQMQDKEKT